MKTTTRVFALAALASLSAAPARAQMPEAIKKEKKPEWKSSAAAGLTLTSGNSETLMATVSATTDRKWDQNELSLGADGAYGQNKDRSTGVTSTSAESAHGFVQYNRLFSERLYGYGRLEGLYDGVADINYRVTLSPGAGYYFIKNKTVDLSGEVGPGYVIQSLGGQESDFATLRVAEKFHYAISDRARIWQSVEWLPQVDKFDNYIINAEIGIEADITPDKKISLRSFLQDTYNSQPASGFKKNDMKLVTALAYKF
ncbi:MAG TPA: DUF481 domain-containing protein [Verrucomicrobiae bacterium]|nr:DUF481 domain-containing protein [Verrucomicrobiae bacterium]